MAKISELPVLANPLGSERIPAIDGDGRSVQTPIGTLVDAAVSPSVVTAETAAQKAERAVDQMVGARRDVDPGGFAPGTMVDATGRVVVGVGRDGRVRIPLLDRRSGQRPFAIPAELDGLVDGEIDEATGALVWGVHATRGFFTPQGDFRDWQARGMDNIRKPASYRTIAVALTAGQSNGADALDFGQLHRQPAPFGEYPTGYNGELDTASVTRTTDPKIFSQFGFNPSEDRLVQIGSADGQTQFGIWETYQATESKLRGFALRMRRLYPDLAWALSQAFAEGGQPLNFLDRPSEAQILAGVMETTSVLGNVTIPKSSAEYRMLVAGQPLSEIWRYSHFDCATRFYKGARALAAICNTAWRDMRLLAIVATVIVSHMEDATQEATYQEAYGRYLDNLRDAVKAITRQSVDPVFVVSIPGVSDYHEQAGWAAWKASGFAASYAYGGANSAYIEDEALRKNDFASRVIKGTDALARRPWAYIGYSRSFRENRIHSEPFTMREQGEYTAELVADVAFRQRPRAQGFRVVRHEVIGQHLALHVETPLGETIAFEVPTSTGTHMIRAGMPYGFEYWAQDGAGGWTFKPLAQSDVTTDGRRILIKLPAGWAPGDRFGYNIGSRAGSVVTTGAPAALWNWRDGQPNKLHHRLLTFQRYL